MIAPSVQQFLGYFLKADIVFTDSFHGTVYSLIYEKRFAVTMPTRFSGRIGTLLKQIDGEGLICSNLDVWERNEKDIDYGRLRRNLNDLRVAKRALLTRKINQFRL